ncbi:MAG: L,D-transpeptidase, partial [Gammaproteobacteria bacterium]|nr:L,D-transpeptidase [Gammaproteobacteria bacterium]
FALHGSTLPGYNASHGCVRLFFDDAKWLNQDFLNIGTRVTVSR